VRPGRRRAAVALAVALAVGGTPALAACGRQADVKPVTRVGRAAPTTTVLVDPVAEQALAANFKKYARGRKPGFRYGAGSADDIASTVKHGRPIDMVVLPEGPALDRVEDELLEPATLLGTIGATRYYVGAVTSRALPFTAWVLSPNGRATLRANGVR
jgi:hypothetical protein